LRVVRTSESGDAMTTHRTAFALTVMNLVLLLATPGQAGRTESTAPVLRAQAIELIDQRGQVRSPLDVEQHGSGLLLANDATEPGVHLLAGGNGTSLRLADEAGRQTPVTPRQP
jgi:hypothetical protein